MDDEGGDDEQPASGTVGSLPSSAGALSGLPPPPPAALLAATPPAGPVDIFAGADPADATVADIFAGSAAPVDIFAAEDVPSIF